ncbi:MAG: glycosyltransferase [Verrucomicrobiota bacterium]|nr:glycosyltransferase [Verrucomicrobiota bacterium]
MMKTRNLKDPRRIGGSSRGATKQEQYPIVVHSHLRWDWVWQRPQQFLSRLSRRHPVLFVEEPLPLPGASAPRAVPREIHGLPNLTVVRTEFPPELLAERDVVDTEQQRLVKAMLGGPFGKTFAAPVQWFYDPMAVTAFVGQMEERANVYDCMDQLSQFRGAPRELIRRERELLTVADVVFAGGPRIHKAKRLFNRNCHCYGCGVDVGHFGQARLPETQAPADLASLPQPALGYFGVVDERLDYELIAALADAHPEWSIVIIGPTAKVDPAGFPRRANLHWLGGRDYNQLPSYVKGLDVCLMPFALNEATEFINPTKALEYMATGRPIVSTAIADVVLQFSHVVEIANGPAGFIAACERAIALPDPERIAAGLELAARNSWEVIVSRLEQHIADVLNNGEPSEICAA